MRQKLAIAAAALAAGLPNTGIAKEDMPANVIVRTGHVVDRIDWSFSPPKSVDFARVKRCAATNIQNDEIRLRDSSGSWVGPATGNYYQTNNSFSAAGGSIFKVVDDQNRFLVAQGWISKPVFGFSWILKFDMELALDGQSVGMVMRNIKLAMTNTGSASNDGFQDLLTSYRFKQNYETLSAAADAVKSCILA